MQSPTETRHEDRLEASRLNLGCGQDQISDFHNVDISSDVQPDEVVDLQQTPWPWPDDSFSHTLASHVLEHLDPVPWDEICRVLAPGGTLVIVYPIGNTRFEDPTHQQFWNWNTAAAISGERKHAHAHVSNLSLVTRDFGWNVTGRLWRAYTRYRLAVGGPGAWMGQVPGLFGEVTATYEYRP
ncbi:methyltransferase domain-containing protein [Natrinema sp. DC36]|uniref:class I SAM-dependent methyltransferase n=1 Tax=Natrinema sp. DC36 TaxID=2878680 RepID=UPI001CF0B0F3|nr:methyltransferase domain-containing protein [Natrinema sp. DC36]